MTLVIGTDEAGYGPNLGPLVVSATAWRIPDDATIDDLPGLVAPTIQVGAGESAECPAAAVRVADSKQLYQPGGSLRGLELPCLAFSLLVSRDADRHHRSTTPSYDEYWRTLSADHLEELQEEFWWSLEPPTWPVAVTWPEVNELASALEKQLAGSQLELVTMRSATIVPQRFNDAIEQLGNKAQVLTQVTLSLIARIEANHRDEPCILLCDRHGGRTRYRDPLQEVFEDDLIQIWQESTATSRYRWGTGTRRRECWFMTGGERHLPVALASMNSKYLRELTMAAFNGFWRQHLPDLKKTAGYPSDAKRFRKDVDATRQRLKIKLSQFWRNR